MAGKSERFRYWLTFDPETERHTGDFADQANVLLKDPNREGFVVPEPGKV